MRHWAEAEAKAYLQTQGYIILAENYTVRGAEVDLIAQDGDTLVFVEVKQRRSTRYGSAAETISAAKIELSARGCARLYRRDLRLRRPAAALRRSTDRRQRLELFHHASQGRFLEVNFSGLRCVSYLGL